MPRGVIDTQYVDFPSTVDELLLKSLETRSGYTLADLTRLADQAMTALNTNFDEDVASLISFTTNPKTGVNTIGRKSVKVGGERTIPRGQYVGKQQFQLPMEDYEITTGFTEKGLMGMSADDFNREMQAVVDAFKMLYKGMIYTTLFDPTPVAISEQSNVLSPRFAGSGTGAYAFQGNYPNGTPLPAGYTHYWRTSEANLWTTIRTMRYRLSRWHLAPFDLQGSETAIEKIVALDEFVPVGEAGIDKGAGVATATLDPDVYLGQLPGRIRVRHPQEQIGSTDHFTIYKTYGQIAQDNPLKWLFDPFFGREAYLRSRETYPLAESVAIQHFGIGVDDRVGATIAEINNSAGSYEPPVIGF